MEFPRTHSVVNVGISEGLHFGAQIYVSRSGTPLIDEAFGKLDEHRSASRDSLFIWRSAGKPITSVAIAQLVELGKIDWDEPVASVIPEFAQGGKSRLSIGNLLTHTAGFRTADRISEELPWGERIAGICATSMEAGWDVDKHAGYQLWSSWQILAEIVRRLSKCSFGEYIHASIFSKAAMASTTIGIPPARLDGMRPQIAPVYSSLGGHLTPHPRLNSEIALTDCRPGTNARGPVRELGRFYETVLGLGDATLISRLTLQRVSKRHREGRFDQTFQHTIDFGLGFVLNSNRYGVDTVPYGYGRHASEEAFGHSGAQVSCAFADPKHDLVVAWVFNGAPNEPRHQRRARELNSAIYEDLGLAK